jgi:Zn-dependent protease with chaperone function
VDHRQGARRFTVFLVLLLTLGAGAARGQEPAPPSGGEAPTGVEARPTAEAPSTAGAPPTAEAPPAADSQPAAEAPPALVENALGPPPPDDPKNEAYAHGGYLLFALNTLFSCALLWVILATGFSARMQRWAERISARPNLKVALYAVLFTLVGFVAGLPLDIWGGFLREKKYGFMNQTFGGWMGDQGKGLAVSIIVQAIFFPLLYLVIRRLGRAWWLPGAALAIGFVILLNVIVPVWVAPLFNTFTPLRDEALRKDILDLAHSQGIPADEVYEVDASKQSEHTNAYVAGLMGTQRVVLFDTLLKRYAPREIRFVMGHEMGHYVLHHVWKTVAFFSVIIVAGLWIVDVLARRILRSRPSWGIGGLEQPASIPLLLLLLTVIFLVARPAISSYSRWQEHSSDRFGLDLVRDPEAAASVFRKFAIHDLSEVHVNPLIEMALYTHPSVAHRIEFAREWANAHGVAGLNAPPPAGESAAADPPQE